MGVFLPYSALPGLKKYKYASEDRSLVSKYILKPFYTTIIEYFPKWVAPNLITFLGLVFSMVGFFTVVAYDPFLEGGKLPQWAYFSFAVELLLYQTLDACDGLQARRTGSSSPLGELFDHCVDAINTSLGVVVFCASMEFSHSVTIGAEFACTLNFYLSTWEEYHTGKLYLSAFSGPVEGVLMCALFVTINGIVGPGVWDTEVIHGLSIKSLLQAGMCLGLIGNTYEAAKHVAEVSSNDSLRRFRGLLPFGGLWTAFGCWLLMSPTIAEGRFIIIFICTLAIVFALMVGQIITAHVTKQPFPMWNSLLLVPISGIFVHMLAPNCELEALLVGLGVSLGVYGCFVFEVVEEITSYLDIGCFYIKNKTY